MIRVKEISNSVFGKVFGRISTALKKYAPQEVVFVESDDADLFLVHAVGGEEYLKAIQNDLSKTVLIQHCYYTTNMDLNMWWDMWKECKLVTSFHDLKSYVDFDFNFYQTPWGAEPDTFTPLNLQRNIKVFTTGHVATTECIDKVYEACRLTNSRMVHTGEKFHWDSKWYQYRNYMPDGEYNHILNQVQYVAGLRLIEGFECHCIEGAMTGAIPIVPDLPSYSYYKDFAELINVNGDIAEQLGNIFSKNDHKSLDYAIINYVRNEFSWEKIVRNLYKQVF